MNLKDLMIDTKEAWVDYPGCAGFSVLVANLSRKELLSLRKRCTVTKMNRKSHTPEETLDEDKFVAEFSSATIKNWKGLKLKYLEDLLLVDLQGKDPESTLEYSTDNAEGLVTGSQEFDGWLNDVVFDLGNFRGESKRPTVEKAGKVE